MSLRVRVTSVFDGVPMSPNPDGGRPVVIGHRGAPGHRPEHTLASYRHAIRVGADRVAVDLVLTRDGVLVARHENELGLSTDVAQRPRLAGLRRTVWVDGRRATGWFCEDLTLEELKTLRAVERLHWLRRANVQYDGLYDVPTLDEVLDLVRQESALAGRPIGVHVELRHPGHLTSQGLRPGEVLLDTLGRHGLDHAASPVVVQSFDSRHLRRMADATDLTLVQLLKTRDSQLVGPEVLARCATYVAAVGFHHELVLPRDETGTTSARSGSVERAHQEGLAVHVRTLRDENHFLPAQHRRGTNPRCHGDGVAAATDLIACGVDALVADQPDTARRAVGAAVPG